MKRILFASLVMAGLVLAFASCGETVKKTESEAATEPEVGAQAEEPQASAGDVQPGVELAKEILAVFDQAVEKSLELAKDKPEAAVLKPQLQDLLGQAKARMLELNARYRGLKETNIPAFAAANSYLSDNRPGHVTRMFNVLGPVNSYYNYEKGEQEIVQLLSAELVKLIDVSVELKDN